MSDRVRHFLKRRSHVLEGAGDLARALLGGDGQPLNGAHGIISAVDVSHTQEPEAFRQIEDGLCNQLRVFRHRHPHD